MTLELAILTAVSVAGIVASVHAVVRDGYRRIPTRRF